MDRNRFRLPLLLLAAANLSAQTASPPPAPPLFTRSDAVWSAAFLVGSIALTRADVRIARAFNDRRVENQYADSVLARNFARVQEGTLTVGNLALWAIARLARAPTMADITFHAAESVVIASATSQVIRGPLGRSRPYVTNSSDAYDFHFFQGFGKFRYRAFPSIHEASAFAVATVYTMETKRRAGTGAAWIVGPIVYTLALGPGVSRMYTGQHWASDIVSGAFLGTLAATKVMKYNHDINPKNRVNRFFLGDKNVQLKLGANELGLEYSKIF